jgi:hypothetical protein
MSGTDEPFRTRCPACNVTYDVRQETPDDHTEGCAVREKLAWGADEEAGAEAEAE